MSYSWQRQTRSWVGWRRVRGGRWEAAVTSGHQGDAWDQLLDVLGTDFASGDALVLPEGELPAGARKRAAVAYADEPPPA